MYFHAICFFQFFFKFFTAVSLDGIVVNSKNYYYTTENKIKKKYTQSEDAVKNAKTKRDNAIGKERWLQQKHIVVRNNNIKAWEL